LAHGDQPPGGLQIVDRCIGEVLWEGPCRIDAERLLIEFAEHDPNALLEIVAVSDDRSEVS
jgi:hypothetical protein